MSIITRKPGFHRAVENLAVPAAEPADLAVAPLVRPAAITSVAWKSATGGDWSTAADWNTGKVPTASNSATIAAAGTYTVTISTADTAYSLLVNNKNVAVSDTSSLSLTGALTVTAGYFELYDGGSINGGTLSTGANGGFYFGPSDGTNSSNVSVLNGVTYQGTLNLGTGEGLAIGGTLTLQGANGTGGGVINLTGQNDYLYITASDNTPTLANGAMDIGTSVNAAMGGANIEFTNTQYNYNVSETLTIASNFDIVQSGTYAIIDKANPYSGYGYTASVYNNGTITAGVSGGHFLIGYTYAIDSFINAGSVAVSNGDSLSIYANATYNTGTITVNDAVVSINNLYASTGGTILLTNSATAGLGGNYNLSAVQSISGGTIYLSGTLTNAGTLFTSNGDYLDEATVNGGVITDASGAQIFYGEGGTTYSDNSTVLNSVTYQGTLNLGSGSEGLAIGGTLTMQGANGTGGGVINLTGQNDYLYITAAEYTPTLANGVMNIGSAVSAAAGGANIEFTNTQSSDPAESLTIASNFDIVQSGTYAIIDKANPYSGYSYTAAVYNNGTITAGISSGEFLIGDANAIDSFTNAGSIAISNGDYLGIDADTTVNSGTITVNDATVVIANLSASAGGTILLSNGSQAYLDGSYTLAAVQSVSGGAVYLSGTLTNGGILLTSHADYLDGVTVNGGVIRDGSGTQNFYSSNGTNPTYATVLNGVTYQGTLNLGAGGEGLAIGGTLTMEGGTGNGGGVINLTGQNDYLYITASENTPTLANGVMNIGSSANTPTGGANIEFTNTQYSYYISESLTIAANFDIVQSGTYAIIDKAYPYSGYSYTASVYNNGTITAGVSGGAFYIGYSNAIDSFTNAGSIAVSNGDDLGIFSNATYNTGTITVDDATVDISNLSASAGGTVLLTNSAVAYLEGSYDLSAVQSISGGDVYLGGTLTNTGTLLTSNGDFLNGVVVNGGLITDAAGAQFFYGGSGTYSGYATVLNSVTYQGTLNLGGGNEGLAIGGTLTMQGANGTGGGVINLTGQDDYLYVTYFESAPTLANGVMDLGSSVNTATGGANIEFTNTQSGYNTSETLTIASSFDIVQSGTYAIIDKAYPYSGYSYTASIYNAGTISAGVSGGEFIIGDTNAIDSFTNAGTIAVSNDDYMSINATSYGNISNGTLAGGSWAVTGGSTLLLVNSPSISTDAANITLGGAGSELQTSNGTTLDSTLATIGTGGTLNILGGRGFTGANAFVDNGLLSLGGGKFTEASLRVAAGAKISGFGTLANNVSNSGVIEANGGTLLLSGVVNGTGSLQIDQGGTLSLASTTAENVTFTGISAGLAVTKTPASFTGTLIGFGPGDSLSFGTTSVTAAAFAGSKLNLTLAGSATQTYALAAAAANERLGISSNAHTVTAYRYAAASTHTPEPVAFGNHHVGDLVSTTLSMTNTAAADGYSETLDASIGGVTGAAGSFTGLAAGATNSSSLSIGLNTASTGAITGTATITLFTDGTGTDGGAALSIGTQTVTVTGAVYAYAAPTLANGGTVTLANSHVGQAISGFVTITNSAAANGYAEALDASLGGASAGFSASGSFAGLAAGASNSALTVGYTAAAGGTYSGTASLGLLSDGTGIDGLGTTTLTGQTVTITGAAYAYASAQLASAAINLGVVHVGSNASLALGLSNAALANGFSEALDAAWGAATGAATLSGSLTGLAAGSSASSLFIGVTTSASGTYSGSAGLVLISDGTGIDGLGTTTLGTQTITVTGIVDNYAQAAFQDLSSTYLMTGTSTNETINLGSIQQGGAAVSVGLGVLNAATGLSDLLQGTIAASGGTAGFIDTGFGSFSGLGAGASEHSQSVTLTTSSAGTFSETILLSSAGTNASGYNGALANETLTITGTITPYNSTTYTLAVGAGQQTLVGADGGDIFIAPVGSLNSHLSLTGGNGANVLQLQGSGYFDLGAPSVLANVQTITAYEGQLASKTAAATNQILFLRNGSTETVNVVSGLAASGNTNPETITIYDGTDKDTFTLGTGTDLLYLGAGTDSVTIGGVKNSIVAGGGTAVISATSALAAASIVGTTTGSTTLNITSAGTVVLNAADTYVSVNLIAGSKLTMGKLGFISANGAAGTDTITAGAANQTLIGGKGDVLTGYTGGSDNFAGTTAGLNGDTIANWTTGDVLDISDMANATLHGYAGGKLTIGNGSQSDTLTVKAVAGSTLSLANFTVIGADGSGGTLIGWHS